MKDEQLIRVIRAICGETTLRVLRESKNLNLQVQYYVLCSMFYVLAFIPPPSYFILK